MKFSRSAVAVAGSAATLGLLLAGCSSAPAEPTDGDAEQTITVWGWSGSPGADTMNSIIDAFEEANPNITVEYNEIANTDYENKATLGLTSGQDIDVLAVRPNPWADANRDFLLPVSDYPGAGDLLDRFNDGAVAQETSLFSDGVVRSVPLGASATDVAFYNVDLLAKAGLTEPPATWDDFAKLTAGLKANAPDVVPGVIPSDGWVQDDIVMTLAGQIEPDYFDNVRYHDGKWNTPTLVQALTTYRGLYADGILDSSTIDVSYADAMQLFDTGKAAVVFTGTWEAGRLLASYREANHLAASDVGIMPIPADDPDTRGVRSFVDVTYGIPAKSTHQAAAAKFVEFMTAGDGVDVWGPQLSLVPSVEGWELPDGVLTTDVEKESYALLQDLVAHPHSDRNVLGNFENQQGVYDLQVAAGTMTPEEAAEQGQSDLDSGKYN